MGTCQAEQPKVDYIGNREPLVAPLDHGGQILFHGE